jgi:lysophospholipase L1-like esterase
VKRRWPAAVLAGLAALVLLDLALSLTLIADGELAGRPLPPFGAITNARQRAALERMLGRAAKTGINAYDRELGWTNRRMGVSEDGLYHTNSEGLRGRREYAELPPAGAARVLAFGDSFTFGDEVGDDDTWPARLEALRGDVEALNFGVSGSGTDQQLLRFRREGRGRGADLVCLGLLLENIGRNVNRYRPLWYPGAGSPACKPRFALDESGALELVPLPYADEREIAAAVLSGAVLEQLAEHEYWRGRPSLPTGRLSSLARIAAGAWAYRERQPRPLWSDPRGEPYRVTLSILEALRAEAQADGARGALVLLLPMRLELEQYLADGERYWDQLSADLERRGIASIDLMPRLAEAERAARAAVPAATIWSGGHLGRAGNEIVARAVIEVLERLPPR